LPEGHPRLNPIEITDTGPIRTITLNRPEARNALSPAMQMALIHAVDSVAHTKSVRVLVITGAGESFCAGLDLAALRDGKELDDNASASRRQMADDAHRIARILRALYELPVPTIAAVNGAAVAGGTGIATVCDFTLAVPTARFGYPEVKIGFVPALVSAYLALQVGDKRARDLLLTGRLITAEDALHYGMVTEVVPVDLLTARVQSLAEALIANSPESISATKALLADQNRAWLDHAVELALAASSASRRTADFREGVSAFLEKRKPRWSQYT
jgi:methylglutaconyl-CoA hydratase